MPVGPSSPPRHALDPAPEDVAFRLRTGGTARSLAELEERLAQVAPADAWHHREHYPHWVRDVVGDASLARRLEALAAIPDPDAYRDAALGVLRTRLRDLGVSPPAVTRHL